MDWIDTHSHLYSEEFRDDLSLVIQRARESGVSKIILPNIDQHSIAPMDELCKACPDVFYPTLGLHPTSVDEKYSEILDSMEKELDKPGIVAIGEVGLDFYWDVSKKHEQELAFARQLEWARDTGLPLIIHSRKSLEQILEMIKPRQNGNLKGVFHCYPGDIPQSKRITDLGFLLGIGGVVTFKNAGLAKVVQETDLSYIVLETDAPYLSPVPYRGQRNESSYIPLIGTKISEIKQLSTEEVARKTTQSAIKLFFNDGEPKMI
ncbi:MAG: TatD family hydrolase [Bacteroidales bacterium]|nr:TatD family hydrolase [Bacteroidales bacterium]